MTHVMHVTRHSKPRQILVVISALAGTLSTPLVAQQKVEIRRAVTPEMSMRVEGAFASLRVIGWDKDSIVVTGALPKGFRIDGGIGGPEGTPARGGKLYIDGPETLGPSGGALEIRLPVGATLWAKAYSATIDISGVTGSLDLNIVSGHVTVNSSPRELSVASMDGDVTVNGSPTWTRLKTADGNIVLRGGSTDAGFTTVSGRIRQSDGAMERARFESVTGGIELFGDIARGGDFSIDTHSGAVDVQLAPKASVRIDAASITGAIENTPGKLRADIGRDGRGATLNTMYGEGSARLVIRTFKGTIRLTSR